MEDITEALWGTRVSPATVSNLNKKTYATIEAWRNRAITGEHPYVYLDGIVLKRTWAGEVRERVAAGEGYREMRTRKTLWRKSRTLRKHADRG